MLAGFGKDLFFIGNLLGFKLLILLAVSLVFGMLRYISSSSRAEELIITRWATDCFLSLLIVWLASLFSFVALKFSGFTDWMTSEIQNRNLIDADPLKLKYGSQLFGSTNKIHTLIDISVSVSLPIALIGLILFSSFLISKVRGHKTYNAVELCKHIVYWPFMGLVIVLMQFVTYYYWWT